MERDTLILLFDQILNGADIPTPQRLLRVRGTTAAVKQRNLPYSLLTNLAHTVVWQNIWLNKLSGGPTPPTMEVWKNDWRVPDPTAWEDLRKDFLDGLHRARAIAAEGELNAKSLDVLLRIAIHASYHMGQMNLLKRAKEEPAVSD